MSDFVDVTPPAANNEGTETVSPEPVATEAAEGATAVAEGEETVSAADEKPKAEKEEKPAEPTKLEKARASIAKAKALRQKAASLAREKAQIAQKFETSASEAARLRAQVQQFEERQARIKADPLAAMEEFDIDPARALALAREKKSPDAKFNTLQKQLEQERLARVALEDSIRQEKEQAVQAQEARAAKSRYDQAVQIVITTAADESVYPHLQVVPEDHLVSHVDAVLKEAYRRSGGHQFTIEEALNFIESKYAERARARSSAPKNPAKKPPAQSPKDSKGSATSRTTTDSILRFLPSNFDELGDREQNEAIAKAMKSSQAR